MHPITGKTITQYQKLMKDPITNDVWSTVFGKEWVGMAQGDNKTCEKGTNLIFVEMPMENIGHSMASRGVDQRMISTCEWGTMDKIAGCFFAVGMPRPLSIPHWLTLSPQPEWRAGDKLRPACPRHVVDLVGNELMATGRGNGRGVRSPLLARLLVTMLSVISS